MPVWHESTRALVESGDLIVVGIASEQHRERTALWARWRSIDWPILWDPFNLTGSFAVPNAILVGPDGTVVSMRVRPNGLETLLEGLEPAPVSAEADAQAAAPRPQLAQLDRLAADDPSRAALEALSRCLWSGRAPTDADLEVLRVRASGDERRADHVFQYGVARRLAYDARGARGPDFGRAVAAWHDAYALTPNQYIWRRRIQQYGPRLDQPYDFYAWCPGAYRELSLEPGFTFEGALHLTPTELAAPPVDERVVVPAGIEPAPSWSDAVTEVEVVAVRGTGEASGTLCVHVTIAAPSGVRLDAVPLESVTVGDRVATSGERFASGVHALRYTVDVPVEVWEADEPLPMRVVFECEVKGEERRRVDGWVEVRGLSEGGE